MRRSLRGVPWSLLVGALAMSLWSACGSGGGEEAPRRAALIDMAEYVIIPNYADLVDAAEALADAARALEDAPTAATLDATRDAWRSARRYWKRSQAFEIGPAQELRTAAQIDWTPIRAARVESAIDTDEAIDSAYVEVLGANQKGFLALEYLLFDGADDEPPALALLGGDEGAGRRRFVVALSENIADQARLLLDAWLPEGGDFLYQFSEAGRGSDVFPTLKSALDEVVNQMTFLAEDIADAQLLNPAGRDGDDPSPESIVTFRSANGKRDLIDGMFSLQNTFLNMYPGAAPHSLAVVVRGLNADTEAAIRASIVRSIELAAALPEPLQVAVVEDRDQVIEVQAQAKEAMRRLEIDLITILGSTLRFNPSDGD